MYEGAGVTGGSGAPGVSGSSGVPSTGTLGGLGGFRSNVIKDETPSQSGHRPDSSPKGGAKKTVP